MDVQRSVACFNIDDFLQHKWQYSKVSVHNETTTQASDGYGSLIIAWILKYVDIIILIWIPFVLCHLKSI